MKSTASRSDLPQKAKKKFTLKMLKTPSKVPSVKRSKIVVSTEHPESKIQHIVQGVVRRGLQPVASKSSISLRVDADVLAWFKAQGDGYQTRINSVLKAFRDASV